MSDNKAGQTRPLQAQDTIPREKFYEAVAGQAGLMDKLAQSLLTVELGIPGLYAAVLKLVSGKDSLAVSYLIVLAFICWLVAIVLTVVAMFPRAYPVNPDELRNSEKSIETFFSKTARWKWCWLLASVIIFGAGLDATVLDIFL